MSEYEVSGYERRVFVKDGREQICTSQRAEVGLRWAGWLPAGDTLPAAHPADPADTPADGAAGDASVADGTGQVPPKRTRNKTPE